MPEPTPAAPQTPPVAPPQTPPAAPAAVGAPPQTPPGPPGTAFEHALKIAYPDGVIPSAQPQVGLQPLAPQFNPLQPAATGPTGAPAATGPSGPPATGPAATGASGPPATGPSGPPTKEQLDAAEKAMTLAAGTAFKIVRAENADLSKKLAAETEKREAAERKATETTFDSKEAKELKDKLERAEKRLAIVDLEDTESFQKNIAKPMKAAETQLSQLAAKYEVPIAELRAALAEPDVNKRSDALSELSAKFNRLDTATFDRTVNELSGLQQARESALATAAEQLAQEKAERARNAETATQTFAQDWADSREKALEDLMADKTAVGVIFTPTGDEKFDADVTAAIEKVKTLDVAKMSNQQIAAEFFRSQVLPLATRLISSQFAQIEVLTAEVASLRGGTPPIGDGGPPAPGPAPIPAGATFASVAKQAMQGVVPP